MPSLLFRRLEIHKSRTVQALLTAHNSAAEAQRARSLPREKTRRRESHGVADSARPRPDGERIDPHAMLRFRDEHLARSTGSPPLRGKRASEVDLVYLGPFRS